ncbi:uncharacterized protein LOC100201718 isoform X1 [Hydra vulgaris]|uniref:uncharacterized protein LOC100201718 isoform X1 n=1 Tax=Hydra vulgaris TaxID=6087 RepID=UPI001F5F104C|nr:uncharacterized protein LOC100201718 isoform X1 [Hydra vulgaris]
MNIYSSLYLLLFFLLYLAISNATENTTGEGLLQNNYSTSENVINFKKTNSIKNENSLRKHEKLLTDLNNIKLQTIVNGQNGTKRNLVDHFDQLEVSDIGKPYGDPDDYQRIGDDIYIIRGDERKSSVRDVKTIKEALPDTEKSLTAIIGHLNKEDRELLNEKSSKSQDILSDELFATQKTDEVTFSPNIENISGPELNLLGDLQSSLKQHDNNTTLTINNILDEESKRKELEDEQLEKGLASITKAVENRDKEFIKNDPYAVDPKKVKEMLTSAGMFFKKDQTQTSDDQNLIGNDDEADHHHDENYVNPEIVVGGSRSHAKKRRHKHKLYHRRHKKHKSSNINLKQDNTRIKQYNMNQEYENKINDLKEELKKGKKTESMLQDNQLDTGFFIAEDSDIANLNRRTEDFVDKTVNATVVKIIVASQNKTEDVENRKETNQNVKDDLKNATESSQNITEYVKNATEANQNVTSNKSKFDNKGNQSFLEVQLNSITPDSMFKNKTYSTTTDNLFKNKTNSTQIKHSAYLSLEDLDSESLYNILKDKSAQTNVGNYLKSYKTTHVVDMEGKPGVQIDLYITDNKSKNEKKKRRTVRSKTNTPEKVVEMQGQKKFFQPTIYDNNIEDVALSDAMPDRHTFTSENPTTASSEKLDITDHIGNVPKKSNDLQDELNNEDLKHAVEDSDLKGFDAIKNEIALQDAKTTVDFFNQPSSAKLLSSHLSSGNINDLSQDIKDDNVKMDDDPQKVKIILHIPESASKEKGGDWNTQEALDIFTEQAKAYLNDEGEKKAEGSSSIKSDSEDDATLLTAKKIEALLRENAIKEEELKRNERIKLFTALHNGIGKNDNEKAHFLNVLENSYAGSSSELANISKFINLGTLKNSQSSEKQDDANKMTKGVTTFSNQKQLPISSPLLELIKSELHSGSHESVHKEATSPYTVQSMFNDPSVKLVNPSPDLPTNPATIKFNAPGVETPLRINGGKVIGGNVRGGNVIGGVISGGDFSGGEIQGGKIEGGTFKNGLMIDGVVKNGVVEGGKIKGGLILGGDIKSGLIEGGTVKGGIIDGGTLVDGVIEGGIFKGGTILGGRLVAGEMDGGVLKNGTISGGVMKGGIIESGVLEGGTMLSGILRGGIVKSGIINGGTIDKGVIVQDNAEIGPGVEIHEGVVKGGKISVNIVPQVSSPPTLPNPATTVKSNMFSVEVVSKQLDDHKEEKKEVVDFKKPPEVHNHEDTEKPKKNVPIPTKKPMETHVKHSSAAPTLRPKQSYRPTEYLTKSKSTQSYRTAVKKTNHPSFSGKKKLIQKALLYNKDNPKERKEINLNNINDVKQLLAILEKGSTNSEKRKVQPIETSKSDELKKKEELLKKTQLTIPRIREEQAFAHWSLTKISKNLIEGDFGPSLHIYGGVSIHNGHAILDGIHGYLDAGDYQGECFSDPEVCETGFTIQMTVKVYRDSVFNKTKLFLLDSGATSTDSRGISIFVQDGRIEAMVSTRDTVWCLRKILEPYIEKWISLTLTWRNDKGLFLYINCALFDKSNSHTPNDCENCQNCHKTDRATRMFFGRPNKGPHFKVTHMALGEVSLYNTFSDKQDVEMICGAKNNQDLTASTNIYQYTPSQYLAPPQYIAPPQYVAPPQYIASPQYIAPSQYMTSSQYTLPSILHNQPVEPVPQTNPVLYKPQPALFISPPQYSSHVKPSKIDNPPEWLKPTLKKKNHKNYESRMLNPWPTPANLIPVKKTTLSAVKHPLIDYNADRRSFSRLDHHKIDGGYSQWSGWSECSQTCGEGLQTNMRYCNQPIPMNGGRSCDHRGPDHKIRICMNPYCPEKKESVPVMRLEYGTKKSSVPFKSEETMVIVDGEKQSFDQLETAFEQLKH